MIWLTKCFCTDVTVAFQKVALLEISRSPLLTGVAVYRIQFPNFQKKLLTKFFKGALKLTVNFQEMISIGVPYQEFTDLQTV